MHVYLACDEKTNKQTKTKKSVNVDVLLGKIIPDNVFLFNTQDLIFLSFAKESFVKLDFSILYRTSL